jgi:hypothetical protein
MLLRLFLSFVKHTQYYGNLKQKVGKWNNPIFRIKIKTNARFIQKTGAQKANPSADEPNSFLLSSNGEYLHAFITCFSTH